LILKEYTSQNIESKSINDSLKQSIAGIASLGLMVLNYNKGKEQRELAVSVIHHFGKISIRNKASDLFANYQLIDLIIQM